MKPISLQLYSVREAASEDFFGVLREVGDIGYKGVEMAGLHDKPSAEVRNVLDDLGLVASSAHEPLPTRDTINETVDRAGTLGYDMIISGKRPTDFETVDGIRAAAEEFQSAAELAKSQGLRLGYHNHWWEFNTVGGRLAYEIFLELAPGVFGQLDTYWASNFGAVDVPAVIAKHADRFPILHIKDGSLVKDEPHMAVGAGKMDIPACIKAANADILEWLVVELDHCATDMMTAVRESYAYLIGEGLAEGNR